jgi:hypothetical protein
MINWWLKPIFCPAQAARGYRVPGTRMGMGTNTILHPPAGMGFFYPAHFIFAGTGLGLQYTAGTCPLPSVSTAKVCPYVGGL